MRTFMVACTIIIVAIFVGLVISSLFFARGQEMPMPTGYIVEVESLVVPEDFTQTPIGTFVVYVPDGETVIWRENVYLGTYTTDEQLRTTINRWADPYIEKYERQQALNDLTKTSKIIKKKLIHTK